MKCRLILKDLLIFPLLDANRVVGALRADLLLVELELLPLGNPSVPSPFPLFLRQHLVLLLQGKQFQGVQSALLRVFFHPDQVISFVFDFVEYFFAIRLVLSSG